MTDQRQQLRRQLLAIEAEMKRLDAWRSLPPAAAAFDNDTPFHADSMDFDNWLQWVLIARLHALLDATSPLPASCAVAPMAEHLWQQDAAKRRQLQALLAELDALFS